MLATEAFDDVTTVFHRRDDFDDEATVFGAPVADLLDAAAGVRPIGEDPECDPTPICVPDARLVALTALAGESRDDRTVTRDASRSLRAPSTPGAVTRPATPRRELPEAVSTSTAPVEHAPTHDLAVIAAVAIALGVAAFGVASGLGFFF